MRLSDLLELGCIKVPLAAGDKKGAIVELIDVLDGVGHLADREAVVTAIMEREEVRSTGIGQGLAIPHGKTSAVDRLVMAIGKVAEPIDFDSMDDAPVTLIILLVSPADQTGPHIQALARISRMMTNDLLREKLWAATTSDDLFELMKTHEEEVE